MADDRRLPGRRRFPGRGPVTVVFKRDLRHSYHFEYGEIEHGRLLTVIHPGGTFRSWPLSAFEMIDWHRDETAA